MRSGNRLLQKGIDTNKSLYVRKTKYVRTLMLLFKKMETELQGAIKLFSIFMLPVLQSEQKTKPFEMQNKAGKVANI